MSPRAATLSCAPCRGCVAENRQTWVQPKQGTWSMRLAVLRVLNPFENLNSKYFYCMLSLLVLKAFMVTCNHIGINLKFLFSLSC